MNKKISYLKNPRFKISKAPITMTKVRILSLKILGKQRRTRSKIKHETNEFQS